MRSVITMFILAALAGCQKSDSPNDVRFEVRCIGCSVAIVSANMAVNDTIAGELSYAWSGGVATIDTLPTTAAYNFVLDQGESATITMLAHGREAALAVLFNGRTIEAITTYTETTYTIP